MLKLYNVHWRSRRNHISQLSDPPSNNVIWVRHSVNNSTRDINEYQRRTSEGIIAACHLHNLLYIVHHEFPGAEITSISEFDGLPYLPPDAPVPAWAIERYNYFANTGKLLPSTILHANGDGYTSVTAKVTRSPLHQSILSGIANPYDDRHNMYHSIERIAALGVISSLSDRRGIGQELEQVDVDTRVEIIDELTSVFKGLLNR